MSYTIIPFLIKLVMSSVLISGLAFALLRVLRKESSSRRYWFLNCVFISLLISPLISIALPAVNLSLVNRSPAPAVLHTSTIKSSQVFNEPGGENIKSAGKASLADKSPEGSAAGTSQISTTGNNTVPAAILFFYGFFGAVVVGLYLRKWQKVYAIAGKAREIDDPIISDIASKVKTRIRIGRDIKILQSDKCPYAMVWGIFKPRVILPSYYLRWTPEKIKAILRHEFAHVKQHDNLFLLLTILVSTVYWFNPLVWILIRRHNLEREISCDDMAIGTGSRPLTYAAYLVDIIKLIKFQDAKGVKPVMLTYESNIKARLSFLLGENVKRHIIGLRQITIMAGVTIALTSLISSVSIWAETLSGDSDSQKEKSEFIENLRKNSDSTLFSGKYYKVLKAQGPESTWDKQVGKAKERGYKCYADGSFSYPGDGRVIMHDVDIYDDTKEWRFEADGVTLYRDDNGDIRWEMESVEDYIRTVINVNGVKLKYKVTDSSLRSNTELLWREFYIDGISFPFGETQLKEFQGIVEEIYNMFNIGDSSTIRIIKQ